jgi:hypothetical protein
VTKPQQFGLSVSKPAWPSLAFRFSFYRASRFTLYVLQGISPVTPAAFDPTARGAEIHCVDTGPVNQTFSQTLNWARSIWN